METIDDSFIPSKYELVRPLSEGAFGRVLHIKHKNTKKEFAMKILPTITETDKKRARREVELLKRFSHPRIVGSRNLKDLICEYEERGERIPLDVVVLICNDIVEGLKFMHTHPSGPTPHGNMKPENVLLTVDNRAILCDLGAADEEGVNNSHSSREIGTSEYNAPERLKDDKMRGTPQSDIWSVGVILHRMVTGCRLFSGSTLPEIIGGITRFTGTELASTIPLEIRDVLLRLLDPDPSLRVHSSQIIGGCLFERILGPATPLSRMKGTLNQRQAKRIEDLTNFQFESEEEQWTFVSKSLHVLATTRSKITVKRWTKSSDVATFTFEDFQIPYHPSFLIRDLETVYHLGEYFLVGHRLLDTQKTFAEEGITRSMTLTTVLSTNRYFVHNPVFVVDPYETVVPIDLKYLDDNTGLSEIKDIMQQHMYCESEYFTLETEDHRQLNLNKSLKQNKIKPCSILHANYYPPSMKRIKLTVKTMMFKILSFYAFPADLPSPHVLQISYPKPLHSESVITPMKPLLSPQFPVERPFLPPLNLQSSLRQTHYSSSFEQRMNDQIHTARSILNSDSQDSPALERRRSLMDLMDHEQSTLPKNKRNPEPTPEQTMESIEVLMKDLTRLVGRSHSSMGHNEVYSGKGGAKGRILNSQLGYQHPNTSRGPELDPAQKRSKSSLEQRSGAQTQRDTISDEALEELTDAIHKSRANRGRRQVKVEENVFLTETSSPEDIMMQMTEDLRGTPGAKRTQQSSPLATKVPKLNLSSPLYTPRNDNSSFLSFLSPTTQRSPQVKTLNELTMNSRREHQQKVQLTLRQHRQAELDEENARFKRSEELRLLREQEDATRAVPLITARDKDSLRKWVVLLTAVARTAIISDQLQEDRARRRMKTTLAERQELELRERKKQLKQERTYNKQLKVGPSMRFLNAMVFASRIGQARDYRTLMKQFLFDAKMQMLFKIRMNAFRVKVIKNQQYTNAFNESTLSRLYAIDQMWKEEEGVLYYRDTPRPVTTDLYPSFVGLSSIGGVTFLPKEERTARRVELLDRMIEAAQFKHSSPLVLSRSSSAALLGMDTVPVHERVWHKGVYQMNIEEDYNTEVMAIVRELHQLIDRGAKKHRDTLRSNSGLLRSPTIRGSKMHLTRERSSAAMKGSPSAVLSRKQSVASLNTLVDEKEKMRDLLLGVTGVRKDKRAPKVNKLDSREFLVPEQIRHPIIQRTLIALRAVHVLRDFVPRGKKPAIGKPLQLTEMEDPKFVGTRYGPTTFMCYSQMRLLIRCLVLEGFQARIALSQ
ncbi:putative NEK kinase [Blattamonas nauphoetae]|uniref:non-specific serine/threonine protein kinase n=1 Tax=Blattamonas nauphoetae TaxID=2049346 RepID=A0ABQ9YI21_9EUKA|nr:putative NEK kinase [Blattamonas nauphoetae]